MSTTGVDKGQPSRQQQAKVTQSKQSSSWFSLPAPIRHVFDAFPLLTYEENALPQRIAASRHEHTLHVFTLDNSVLSPNPACLKWQIWLMMKKVPFRVVSANNHASPTGALPFVLPAQKSKKEPQPQAISASKIQRWLESRGTKEELLDIRLEAYISLVDQNVRTAWLYTLYLQEHNFHSVARLLYVETASTNLLVQTRLAHQLQQAAKDQLLRTRTRIDEDEIYAAANAAFRSLDTVLANHDFFSKSDSPNLFDATLFSYTHLLLSFGAHERDIPLVWGDQTLLDILLRYDKLVQHRNRVLHYCSC